MLLRNNLTQRLFVTEFPCTGGTLNIFEHLLNPIVGRVGFHCQVATSIFIRTPFKHRVKRNRVKSDIFHIVLTEFRTGNSLLSEAFIFPGLINL